MKFIHKVGNCRFIQIFSWYLFDKVLLVHTETSFGYALYGWRECDETQLTCTEDHTKVDMSIGLIENSENENFPFKTYFLT